MRNLNQGRAYDSVELKGFLSPFSCSEEEWKEYDKEIYVSDHKLIRPAHEQISENQDEEHVSELSSFLN